MGLFLVTYDLVKEKSGFDYKPLTDAITDIGGVKTQFSVWLVEISASQQAIYNHLKPKIDGDDRLMIIELEQRPSWNTGFLGTKALIDKYFPA